MGKFRRNIYVGQDSSYAHIAIKKSVAQEFKDLADDLSCEHTRLLEDLLKSFKKQNEQKLNTTS